MKIAFIIRSTLYKVPGGDTVQIDQTAKQLRELGVRVDILLTDAKVSYDEYDLFHFFNITRPADILFHLPHLKKPFFITPILIDYSEYDRTNRKGFSGWLFQRFSKNSSEYLKTLGRWLKGNDRLRSKKFLWMGQKKSMRMVLEKATAILPNSPAEGKTLLEQFNRTKPTYVIPNGIDHTIFKLDAGIPRNKDLVLCVARIEGIKNQLNLIRALNNTRFRLIIIGEAAPNQQNYFRACKKIAAGNIIFEGRLTQEELSKKYQEATVHVLPSWFETCGLSSLEAAAMGCNIVITEKGFTRDYFENEAFYCEPDDPGSIREAVEKAAAANPYTFLMKKIREEYTWQHAAKKTLSVYQQYSPA